MSTARKTTARKSRKSAASSGRKKAPAKPSVLKEVAGLEPQKAVEIGRIRLDGGQVAEAEQVADMLIAENPDEGAAHALKGLSAYRSKRFAEAVTSLRRAIELRPRDVTSISNLGAALNETGDKAGAVSAFRRALKIEPAHPGAVRNMVVGLVQAGKTDDAVSVLRRAVSVDPGMAAGYALFGDVERRRGRLLHARSHYCRALAPIDPSLGGAHGVGDGCCMPAAITAGRWRWSRTMRSSGTGSEFARCAVTSLCWRQLLMNGRRNCLRTGRNILTVLVLHCRFRGMWQRLFRRSRRPSGYDRITRMPC